MTKEVGLVSLIAIFPFDMCAAMFESANPPTAKLIILVVIPLALATGSVIL